MAFRDTASRLLLEYVEILADRNAYRHSAGFEYELFDAVGSDKPSPLITQQEREDLRFLAGSTSQWVTYDLETSKFALNNAIEWMKLRHYE